MVPVTIYFWLWTTLMDELETDKFSILSGMVVVCIRVIGEGEDTFNLYTVGRYMHSTALGYMHGFTLR